MTPTPGYRDHVLLTPETTDESDSSGHRLRYAAGMAVATLIGGLVWTNWPPGEVERALSDGCDALPEMAAAYAEGDRAAFDTAAGDAQGVALAAVRSGDLTDDSQIISDAAAANAAYEALYRAAYVAPEAVNGTVVWAGLELTPDQRARVETGLAACSRY